MQKRKPTVLSQHSDQTTATLKLQVDGDILDFAGHFPDFPLLPGVTQVDWVMHFAKQAFNLDMAFAGMEVVKFQEPIFPDSVVILELITDTNRSKLQFKYLSKESKVHSSGKIKLSGDEA